ncbi:hypothetical protein GCM10023350_50250 [Nocardioides endophyticus]|uniref:Bacterial Ig-like domain-containing protein n=1 Tax=Nocardioides endophyticus TaxID=1353775 RepID=A0ABP8ZK40_9ACTN
MRLRNLLAAAAVSALAIGAVGVPAHSVTAPPSAKAGALVSWGDEDNPNAGPAIPIPADLTGPVRSVATNDNVTGVVTLDGGVRVWGGTDESPTAEVAGAPTGVTDAAAIALTTGNAAILRTDGSIRAWGNSGALGDVPTDLRAKAIALQSGTGYAVRPDGTLATWGDEPLYPLPTTGLTDLVDVSASISHVLALRSDGKVVIWGSADYPGVLDLPDFGGKKVAKIATAMVQSGVVFEDGTIDIWGFGVLIPMGEPPFDGLTPATTVTSLSLGSTSAALTADGAVSAWGNDVKVKTIPAALTGQPVSAIAVSNGHAAAVITSFRDLTKPTIAGKPEVGQTLTATPATFSLTPDAPATGQWYAGSDAIAGQTSTTLAVAAAQVGKAISYRTTATRAGQTVTSASTTLGPVTQVTVTPPPAPKAKSKVTAKVKATGKTKKIAKKVKITVTVKTTKGISPAGKVKITLKGKTKKTVNAKVNAKGIATVTVKKVKRGKYTATLAYAGNTRVSSAKATTKFKV